MFLYNFATNAFVFAIPIFGKNANNEESRVFFK